MSENVQRIVMTNIAMIPLLIVSLSAFLTIIVYLLKKGKTIEGLLVGVL